MAFLKKTIWDSLKKANLDPLEAINFDEPEDEDDSSNGSNGIIDKFDERDEDEEASRNEEGEGYISPHTSDSDTVPQQQPTPATRKASHKRKSSGSVSSLTASGETPYLPLSILSPDSYSLNPGDGPVGRKFPWGFADPHNAEHCDFVKLKETVFSEWRAELREASREIFYERWRTSRLNRHGATVAENSGKKSGGILKGGRR